VRLEAEKQSSAAAPGVVHAAALSRRQRLLWEQQVVRIERSAVGELLWRAAGLHTSGGLGTRRRLPQGDSFDSMVGSRGARTAGGASTHGAGGMGVDLAPGAPVAGAPPPVSIPTYISSASSLGSVTFSARRA
jgi:hypothetical protein